ncbi:non-ribosomal peptide synthetase [Dactylosporangium vinaceum]|uniref:Amino acid adenylation domain-containing protein n=1 Tax=Dactylosporangium vinaceum TaxID=53362 RepID=A0ABV5MSY2_9ACTN|nr:non-ribosomal peptide synthetase [Dactylosporangium vinaceum]UAB97653.1 non-ribosomal peptide synthetase [Dactylosporangium vinaceum]
MPDLSLSTAVEDVVVGLPVDRPGPEGFARVHREALVGPAAGRPAHWWSGVFLALLHRYTAAEQLHLLAAADADGAVVVHAFPVAADDTVADLAARVATGLAVPPPPTRLVDRVTGPGRPAWFSPVLAGLPVGGPEAAGHADIALSIADGTVRLLANAARWDAGTAVRMAGHLALLAAAAEDGPIGRLPMVGEAERALMLTGWNATEADWSDAGYLTLLRARVAAQGAETALVHGDRTVTFDELETGSNRVANAVIGLGAGPGERVALLCPTSADFVIAAIGVLKTGAAVVPIDPVNPDPRVEFMLGDAEPVAVLATAALRSRATTGAPVLVLDGPEIAAASAEPVLAAITPDTVSHLIYTSGSTGEPKAVLERHRALANLVHWTGRAYGVRPGDRASWLSTPGFAVQLMEWMPYLALGVAIHVGEAANRSAEQLRDWLVDEGVTHTMLVAALAERVWALEWPATARLRVLVTTAERVHSWPPVDTAFRVVMTYGSTETTNVLSCLDLGLAQDYTAAATPAAVRAVRPVPVGKPIANLRVYLLDPAGHPVPPGVVGRLFVAGAGLAAGYHNRPELTAAKFLANPLPEEPEPILYDTGDLARFRADGVVELLGRSDSQVKVRGFRVELGEVERAVSAAPGVREAVVRAYEPEPGDTRLAAYVGAGDRAAGPGVRTYVTERLPHYMVPAVIVVLDRLPRLANGKVDHQALPDPDSAFRDGLDTDYAEPATAAQRAIAQVWSQLLHLERVGANDNFFDLGGHSVLAVRMIAAVNGRFAVRLRLPDLCAHPTVEQLADHVATLRGE